MPRRRWGKTISSKSPTPRGLLPYRQARGTGAPKHHAPGRVDRARRARDWLEECERELRDQPDVRRAARLYFEMARTCEGPLKDARRALQYYQATLDRSPDYVPAIRAARRLLLGARMFTEALALFDAEARVTRQPRDKATLFLLKGRLLEDVLGNREAAGEAYHTAQRSRSLTRRYLATPPSSARLRSARGPTWTGTSPSLRTPPQRTTGTARR